MKQSNILHLAKEKPFLLFWQCKSPNLFLYVFLALIEEVSISELIYLTFTFSMTINWADRCLAWGGFPRFRWCSHNLSCICVFSIITGLPAFDRMVTSFVTILPTAIAAMLYSPKTQHALLYESFVMPRRKFNYLFAPHLFPGCWDLKPRMAIGLITMW
jgi:hypothetical protein